MPKIAVQRIKRRLNKGYRSRASNGQFFKGFLLNQKDVLTKNNFFKRICDSSTNQVKAC